MVKLSPRLLAVSAALLASSLLSAQTVKYEKYVLPNGMKVILHEDHAVPMVAVNVWYRVGSKDESPGRTGFAHLFEHLMFMGTERVPTGQFDAIMEEGGGSNNASTANDRTNYFESGPSNLLPLLLWLEADRMEDLARTMDQRKLDLQREVVRNERRESENEPYGQADLKLSELLFPQGHPYHHPVIGSHKDLEAATVQDVKQFFETYYVPSNASLVVAGDFNPGEVKPLIASLFGSLPAKPAPPHGVATQPKLDRTIVHDMTDQAQAPRLTIAWHSPAAYSPGDAEMNLAAAVLTRGISSRLYQRLIYGEKPLATDVSAYQDSMVLGSVFAIQAIARPGVSLDDIQKAIDEEVAAFVQKGPTARELERNVAGLETAILNSLQSIGAKADNLNEFEFHLGEPDSFKRLLQTYLSATPEAVRRVAADVLKPNARVILRVTPGPDAPSEADQAAPPTEEAQASAPYVRGGAQTARDQRPTIGPAKAWTPAAPEELKLSNGIRLLYWRRPDLPLMSLTTFISSGSDEDSADKAGLTSLTVDMIDEGAGKRSATAFEEALDLLGASFSAAAGQDSVTISLSSSSSRFGRALDLYADAILKPRFEQKEWDRVKRVQIESLQQALDDPATVARRVAMREYFGKAHPYGRPVSGTTASVGKLTLEDAKTRYRTVFKPSHAVVFAAGSMRGSELKRLLDKRIGRWRIRGGLSQAGPAYPAAQNSKLRVVLVEKPNAPQTVIRFVMPAPTAADPKRIQLQALGLILGGTFTSRLNANLREDKGYTYGAGAGYALEPKVGYFQAVSAVRTDVTGASLKEFLKEFDKLRAGDVVAPEVQKARNTMRTDVMDAASSLGGMLSLAIQLHRAGRPFSALGEDLAALEKLDPAMLNALASGAIPTDKALLVLVGDKAQILKQLEGLGLPEPEVVAAE